MPVPSLPPPPRGSAAPPLPPLTAGAGPRRRARSGAGRGGAAPPAGGSRLCVLPLGQAGTRWVPLCPAAGSRWGPPGPAAGSLWVPLDPAPPAGPAAPPLADPGRPSAQPSPQSVRRGGTPSFLTFCCYFHFFPEEKYRRFSHPCFLFAVFRHYGLPYRCEILGCSPEGKRLFLRSVRIPDPFSEGPWEWGESPPSFLPPQGISSRSSAVTHPCCLIKRTFKFNCPTHCLHGF